MRPAFLALSLFACLTQAAPYKAYNFSVPIDHFHNETRYEPHSDGVFDLRYWFDSSYYRPGGPVFVIAAGETSGEDRFEFLSQGIVTQLAKAYHGLGVILEHRYYGTSYPFEEVTAENLRFLTTEQSLADHAYFAKNIVFPGLEAHDLTAPATPWVAYGGSYAGAQVAFLRKVYPDVFWGAVSSSGVTAAVVDYWKYFEPIRNYAPADCIDSIQTLTDVVDGILIDNPDNTALHAQLQAAFGVSPAIDNTDFAFILQNPLGGFQGRNWDPSVGSYDFRYYCDNITSPEPLYPPNNYTSLLPKLLSAAGYDPTDKALVASLRNQIGYVNGTTPSSLIESKTAKKSTKAAKDSLPKDSTTSWNYQVCTEWGYYQGGATVPPHIRPLLSRLIDIPYLSSFCSSDFGITTPPDVDRINKHGGFNFSYPRVAIIGGAADPWRDATPLAQGLPGRESTDSEPFILIDIPGEHVWDGIRGAVHHWDQNGLPEERGGGVMPPREIVHVQRQIVRFVGGWLREWRDGREDSL
ncbi:putative extracelular serine carboxypeptidase [Aspergillus lucknowensis]|uniref:Serine carboxypeptidase S28-domain-containing protein n=1 Tax=Aspergillus lucknowensis TaxID=176173 RepID=A0ABR4LSY8_9EURO